MRRSIAWLSLLVALMLLTGVALAESAEQNVGQDAELSEVSAYARGTLALLDAQAQPESYLRAAFRFDVEAARTALADSEYLYKFEETYGGYARVYVLEYACVLEGGLPYSQWVAVGVDADGNMAQTMTPDDVTEKIYAPGWYADVDMELIYDVTLAEAGVV
ncbi:MAG TPA: hypothetical protein IAC59_06865 [Candidatus Fimadaptatus faecigallinarum]|uniref:Uncharacterized protein n=1 Tax=Candidatus Fimadaptatus faecigallinarum TaxID=2840814 RepID=A0A9D1LRZ5_9FIRM|nr:hypothetical protein [Candidatus Fimadaptatus faecigallinarum]